MTDTKAPDPSGLEPAAGPAEKPAAHPSGQMTDPARPAAAGSLPKAKISLSDMLVGTTLSDRYRLDEKIGEGAMGWVFLAQHLELAKPYAVKVLRPALSRMRDAVGRFRREARAAAQIGSKHIVDVSDFGMTDNGAVYMVMEYLAGGEDLGTTLRKNGRLEWKRVVDIMVQCCDALQAAHDADIIHRDVKPANLYRMPTEETQDFVKVLDFGIARLVSSQDSIVTATGMVMGTPDYMSPEQAQGRHVDHRADIYSLGASAYALVTGRPPFRGTNEYDVIYKQLNEEPRPPKEVAPEGDIPDWLDGAILKTLAKDPDERFQTMRELAEALQPPKPVAGSAAPEAPAARSQVRQKQPDTLALSPVVLVVGFLCFVGIGALLYVLFAL